MVKIDFKDLNTSVSEYQRRQAKLLTAVAWMLTQQERNILSPAEALKALGIKPTAKWVSAVVNFGEDSDIEK